MHFLTIIGTDLKVRQTGGNLDFLGLAECYVHRNDEEDFRLFPVPL